jgi:hypothetical protein
MLEGLDRIEWAALEHAYGPASDVPELLRALAEGDTEAVDALYGNIWHQGTVYAATAPAVPFLIELLDGPDEVVVPLLQLLSDIARGTSYLDVHQSLMPPSQRPTENEVEVERMHVRAARAAVVRGVPVFVRVLEEGDEVQRAEAACLLGICGGANGALLAKARADANEGVRATAVLALGRSTGLELVERDRWREDQSAAVRVCAALLGFARDGDPDAADVAVLRADVPAAFETLGKVTPIARDGEPLRFVLGAVGERFQLQRELLEAWLTDQRREVRKGAAFAARELLHTWRPAAQWLVPAFTARLDDLDPDVRLWSAWALADIGAGAASAADALWRTLGKKEPTRATPEWFAISTLLVLHDARAAAWIQARLERGPLGELSELLEQVGPWAPGCLDPLIALIPTSEQGNERINVISAVARYGAAAAKAIPAIRAQLALQPHITTRVLGDFGAAAKDALPELRALVADEDEWIRKNAARAVFRICGDATPALAMVEKDLEAGGRATMIALEVIPDLGAAAEGLADKLPPLFVSEDEWTAVNAAAAYWAITQDAEKVLPTLLEHLTPLPRGFVALDVLAQIGPAAHEAIPALREFIESERRVFQMATEDELIAEDERWRTACRQALAKIQR